MDRLNKKENGYSMNLRRILFALIAFSLNACVLGGTTIGADSVRHSSSSCSCCSSSSSSSLSK